MEKEIQISVVIPCRNEERYIAECIHAIYASEVGSEVKLNVFVVDGMSDDNTRNIVHELTQKYPSLKLVDNVKQLTPYAFNLGIYEQACDYVQIIGARHIVSSNYISKALQLLRGNQKIWCVGGRLINDYINENGKIFATAMGTAFGMGIGNFRTLGASGYTDTVTSPMYPYFVFEKIGFFDEELIRNQDDDFNFRVTEAGGLIYFESDISLKYYVRGNFKGLWRQFFQYGYWKVYVNKKHGTITTLRQLAPPAFVFYIALLILLFLLNKNLGLWFSVPMGIYLLLNTYFSISLGLKNKLNGLKLFITFPILHIGYGSGFIKGLIHFLLLNKKPSGKEKRLSR